MVMHGENLGEKLMAWKGDQLKDLAKDRGLSLIYLAKKLGVSRQTINDWIKGQVPKGSHLMALCNELGVKPTYFFSDDAPNYLTLPLHRKRGVAKVTPAMRQNAYDLAKQYEKLFKWAPEPEIVPVVRIGKQNESNAISLAGKLRKISGVPESKPMDYEFTFNLLDKLRIITIFRPFPSVVKGYAFYSKIHDQRVVFVNTETNLLDLIFPISWIYF